VSCTTSRSGKTQSDWTDAHLLASHAFRHLGLAEPARDPAQFGLFGDGEE